MKKPEQRWGAAGSKGGFDSRNLSLIGLGATKSRMAIGSKFESSKSGTTVSFGFRRNKSLPNRFATALDDDEESFIDEGEYAKKIMRKKRAIPKVRFPEREQRVEKKVRAELFANVVHDNAEVLLQIAQANEFESTFLHKKTRSQIIREKGPIPIIKIEGMSQKNIKSRPEGSNSFVIVSEMAKSPTPARGPEDPSALHPDLNTLYSIRSQGPDELSGPQPSTRPSGFHRVRPSIIGVDLDAPKQTSVVLTEKGETSSPGTSPNRKKDKLTYFIWNPQKSGAGERSSRHAETGEKSVRKTTGLIPPTPEMSNRRNLQSAKPTLKKQVIIKSRPESPKVASPFQTNYDKMIQTRQTSFVLAQSVLNPELERFPGLAEIPYHKAEGLLHQVHQDSILDGSFQMSRRGSVSPKSPKKSHFQPAKRSGFDRKPSFMDRSNPMFNNSVLTGYDGDSSPQIAAMNPISRQKRSLNRSLSKFESLMLPPSEFTPMLDKSRSFAADNTIRRILVGEIGQEQKQNFLNVSTTSIGPKVLIKKVANQKPLLRPKSFHQSPFYHSPEYAPSVAEDPREASVEQLGQGSDQSLGQSIMEMDDIKSHPQDPREVSFFNRTSKHLRITEPGDLSPLSPAKGPRMNEKDMQAKFGKWIGLIESTDKMIEAHLKSPSEATFLYDLYKKCNEQKPRTYESIKEYETEKKINGVSDKVTLTDKYTSKYSPEPAERKILHSDLEILEKKLAHIHSDLCLVDPTTETTSLLRRERERASKTAAERITADNRKKVTMAQFEYIRAAAKQAQLCLRLQRKESMKDKYILLNDPKNYMNRLGCLMRYLKRLYMKFLSLRLKKSELFDSVIVPKLPSEDHITTKFFKLTKNLHSREAYQLLDVYPRLIFRYDPLWQTVYHICAKRNNHGLLRMITINFKGDINAKDITGRTALSWAYEFGNEKCIRLLLAAGARPFASRDGSGISVMMETKDRVIDSLIDKAILLHIHERNKPYHVRKKRAEMLTPFWDEFMSEDEDKNKLINLMRLMN